MHCDAQGGRGSASRVTGCRLGGPWRGGGLSSLWPFLFAQLSFLCLLAPSIVRSLGENQGGPLRSPSEVPTLDMQEVDVSRRMEVLSRAESGKCLGSLNIVTE